MRAWFEMKEAANGCGLFLLGQIIRSIAVEDECHVTHLLHRKILHICILVHLKDVHTDARVYVRFRFHRWKEKLLRAKADNENCDDSDDMMCTHERLHCSGLMCDRGRGQNFCCFAFRLISTLIELLEIRPYDPSKFGEFYISAISVEQWSTKCLLQSLDRICK